MESMSCCRREEEYLRAAQYLLLPASLCITSSLSLTVSSGSRRNSGPSLLSRMPSS